jgi:hypothetical protein
MPLRIRKNLRRRGSQDAASQRHMDVRLGYRPGEPFDDPYEAGDVVPESGIYRLECHDDPADTAALIGNRVFPACELCGGRARYRLIQKAPYILEDPDFAP